MAKRFLDTLDDAFEDDILQDVIPMRKGGGTRRKKSFLSSIQEKKSPAKSNPAKNTSANPRGDAKKRRKSFLESIEDALENNAFDDIIPDNPTWKKNKRTTSSHSDKEIKKLETRLSTSIPTNVLDRAKEIAKLKDLNLKDVINIALKWYVENDGKL